MKPEEIREFDRLCEKAGLTNLARQAAAFQEIRRIVKESCGYPEEELSAMVKIAAVIEQVRP